MTLTFDLRCGVSGDMLLGSLMDMYSREGDVDAVLNTIKRAASVMSPTDVSLSRVTRNGVDANTISVNWEPMEGEAVGGREMREHLERGIQAASLDEKGAAATVLGRLVIPSNLVVPLVSCVSNYLVIKMLVN